jgi:CTP:molybdopterin cytidylyltransferase MocA
MGHCKERIVAALRWTILTEQEIADALFVNRHDIRRLGEELANEGLVFRKRRHSEKAGRPVWFYSSVKFPPLYGPRYGSADEEARRDVVRSILGDWDATTARGS